MSGVAGGDGGDTASFFPNTGGQTIINQHTETSRTITPGVETIPPGGSYIISADVTTNSPVRTHIRAWLITSERGG
ncbi:hypothetical protein [Streptomyces synnematoformans]|uniref:hypothetical protein n=1 Tax=Streptomyces synnematoformans TaxID=415721 RepID=UPI0031DD6F55